MKQQPDILMLSNYVWNEALSHEFFRNARQLNPAVLNVAGSPNIPLEPVRQAAYLARHPELDLYVLDEGDFTIISQIAAQDILYGYTRVSMTLTVAL